MNTTAHMMTSHLNVCTPHLPACMIAVMKITAGSALTNPETYSVASLLQEQAKAPRCFSPLAVLALLC